MLPQFRDCDTQTIKAAFCTQGTLQTLLHPPRVWKLITNASCKTWLIYSTLSLPKEHREVWWHQALPRELSPLTVTLLKWSLSPISGKDPSPPDSSTDQRVWDSQCVTICKSTAIRQRGRFRNSLISCIFFANPSQKPVRVCFRFDILLNAEHRPIAFIFPCDATDCCFYSLTERRN